MCILFVMTLNIRCIWEKRSDVRKVSSVMILIFVVEGRQGLRRAPSRCMGQSGTCSSILLLHVWNSP